MSPDSPRIFMHLPKTAGTTFLNIARRHFHPSLIYYIGSGDLPRSLARFKSLPQEKRHSIKLLTGHQVFGLHEWLAPNARYLTVVRHPVARIVSHYHYVLENEHPMFIDAIRNGEMNLESYAASSISGELENGQTRWLAGISDQRPLTHGDYQQAIEHVTQFFDWIGVTENFDESLAQLALDYRWWRVYYRKENVASQPTTARTTARAREIILERNQLDAALWSWVQRRMQAAPIERKLKHRLGSMLIRAANLAYSVRRAEISRSL